MLTATYRCSLVNEGVRNVCQTADRVHPEQCEVVGVGAADDLQAQARL